MDVQPTEEAREGNQEIETSTNQAADASSSGVGRVCVSGVWADVLVCAPCVVNGFTNIRRGILSYR
jgi:hypothetical protein